MMKKYIAFDFGAGTTCVAEFAGVDNTGNLMWRNLPILTKAGADCSEEIPTYLAGLCDNSYAIGSHVMVAASVKWKARAWKTRPTKATEASENLTKHFMREVFKHFSDKNREYLNENNDFVFAIGCPCDWSDTDIDQYKSWTEESYKQVDLLRNKKIELIAIKESQGAMLYARKEMNLCTDSLEKGVLLIDMGSSTTDFTYVKGLSGLHCGVDLGANDIDVCFAEQAVNNSESSVNWYNEQIKNEKGGYTFTNTALGANDIDVCFAEQAVNNSESFVNWYNEQIKNEKGGYTFTNTALFDFLALARNNKEEMYACSGDYNAQSYEYVDAEGEDQLIKFGDNKVMRVSYYNDEILDDASSKNQKYADKLNIYTDFWKDLKGKRQSWRQHFRDVLKIVKTKWALNKDVSIVVTGGASRMTFIEEDIRKIFEKDVVVRFSDDTNKSFSVGRGLAYAAYANDKLNSKKDKIATIVNGEDIQKSIQGCIEDALRPIAESIRNKVYYGMCYHLDKKYDWDTFNSIQKMLNEKYNLFMKSEIRTFNNSNFNWWGALLKNEKIKSIIKEEQREFGVSGISFKAGGIQVPELTVEREYYVDLKGDAWGKTGPDDWFGHAWLHDYHEISKKSISKELTTSKILSDILQGNWVLENWVITMGLGFLLPRLMTQLCEKRTDSILKSLLSKALVDNLTNELNALAGVYLIENQN